MNLTVALQWTMQEGLNIFESGNLEKEKMQSGLSNDLQLKASRDVSWAKHLLRIVCTFENFAYFSIWVLKHESVVVVNTR